MNRKKPVEEIELKGIVVSTETRNIQKINQSDYANLPKGWFTGSRAVVRRIFNELTREWAIIITEAPPEEE